MRGINFPLYALRAYDFIQEHEGFTIISTRYSEYVLDCKRLRGDYTSRRMQMLDMKLPFKLYPLKERFSMVSQLVNSSRRDFIDSDGKVGKYKPQKYYKVEYTKVLVADRTWNGYYRLMTKLPVPFVTEEVANYIGYIKTGAGYELYEVCDERKSTTRKKL